MRRFSHFRVDFNFLFLCIFFSIPFSCVFSEFTPNQTLPLHPSKRVWAVRIPRGINPDAIAARDGFINKGTIGALKDYYLFEPIEDGHDSSRRLYRRSNIEIDSVFKNESVYAWSEEQLRRPRFRRKMEFNDPLWPNAWYLQGDAFPGKKYDIGVQSVWEKGIFGDGVHVAVVDDGLQGDHPDLIDQFVAETSYNFLSKNPDVFPKQPIDSHGTRCAGEIVAKPNNNICAVGVAYKAKVSGLKIIGDIFPNDADEASALSHRLDRHHIYSSSWGPKDDGASLDGPGPLAQAALEYGVTHGRGGKGALYVFAGGNGGSRGDNCNFDGYANSLYTITIGGLAPSGSLPFYAEPCAAHLAMMYGGGDGQYIATTDMYSGCTTQHTGTSAAAPLVSGILALLLEKRPDLSYRDIQHLIVRSTLVNDPLDSDWLPNRAGRLVNHKYGFGLLHANRLIEKAETWTLVPSPLLSFQLPKDTEKRLIPTTAGQPLRVMTTVSLEHAQTLSFIEQIQVEVKIKHPQRGKLVIRLLSPEDGRSFSVLASARPHDLKPNGFHNWKFSTVRHWDESPLGNWTLEIEDTRASVHADTTASLVPGYLESWSIKFIGRCSEEDTYFDPVTNVKKCWLEKPKHRTIAIIEEQSTSMYFLGLFSGWLSLLLGWFIKRCLSYFHSTFKPHYPLHMESALLLHAEEGEAELKKKLSSFGETDPNLNDKASPHSPLLKTGRIPNQDQNIIQRSATPNLKYNSKEKGEGQGSSMMVQNLVEFETEAETSSKKNTPSSMYSTSSPRSLTLGSGDFQSEKEKEQPKSNPAPLFILKNLNPLPKLDPSSIHSTSSSKEQDKA